MQDEQSPPPVILYKYVPFASGRKIIETATIGFSQPKYFNDPFDMPSYPPEPKTNPVQGVFDNIHVWAKETAWADNTGILSLTRTPTNPLMWAHYADMHRGMVIGIDVNAAGMADEACNLIPAQYGSIIYVSGRPSQPFMGKPGSGLAVGRTHHFPHEHYEKLQRLFLHKPLCWSYEEEVRVVKCLNGIGPDGGNTASGRFRIVDVGNRQLHVYSLPSAALREVYFGFRLDLDEGDAFYYHAKELHPHLRFLDCHLEPDRYLVGAREYTTIAEDIEGSGCTIKT